MGRCDSGNSIVHVWTTRLTGLGYGDVSDKYTHKTQHGQFVTGNIPRLSSKTTLTHSILSDNKAIFAGEYYHSSTMLLVYGGRQCLVYIPYTSIHNHKIYIIQACTNIRHNPHTQAHESGLFTSILYHCNCLRYKWEWWEQTRIQIHKAATWISSQHVHTYTRTHVH